MKLAELIRKNESEGVANANPANLANDEAKKGGELAKLATLALANPINQKTQLPARQWVAIACACRFDNCTMIGRQPLECYWSGVIQ